MKKFLAAILAFVIAFSLAACAESEPGTQPLSTQPLESVDASNTPTGEVTEETTEPVSEAGKAEVAESVVYEDDSFKITVTGMDADSLWGTEINLLVENNSDKNISLSGDTFVVNGITLIGNLYIDDAAGKKANGSMILYTESLDVAGINDVATVYAYDAHIIDTDTYESILDVPMEIKTSIADGYTQAVNDEGEQLWQADGITVIAQVVDDSIWGKRVKLLIKNDTEANIIVQADSISVNGFMVAAIMSSDVVANTACFADMTVFESDLESNGIENIEEVAFTLSILNPDTYETIATYEELTVYAAAQ